MTLFEEVAGLGYPLAYATFTRQVRERALRPHCEACAKTRGRVAAVIEHPPGQELSEHDAAFNRAFSSIRAAGEHANARLKTWRMLSEEGGRYRAPLDKYDEMLAAIIGLHNYRISTDENGPFE